MIFSSRSLAERACKKWCAIISPDMSDKLHKFVPCAMVRPPRNSKKA